ncbi:hypothetical protein AAFF_G00440250 [Aldrovandia affinis]|uniref:OCA domain-containing protein n=1 Tax=Aldrovandia affinis TaxID=143900 RepID=A0AAD7S9E9_9TELE|nr:hypothetical protein AAFF_G00440250 [Aldrovandia affinis]
MLGNRDRDKNRKGYEDGFNFISGSPLPGEPATPQTEPNSPVSGFSQANNLEDRGMLNNRNTHQITKTSTGSKRYLGVRVKMPVRDMLRKIRVAKGLDPNIMQGKASRASGEKKRVTSSGDRRKRLNKQQTSLEDLAIIVEVLEEDLKASKVHGPHLRPKEEDGVSPQYRPEWQRIPWTLDLPCPSQGNPTPPPQNYGCPSELSPTGSPESHTCPPPSPPYGSILSDGYEGGYHSDETEERFGGPHPQAPCSPYRSEYRSASGSCELGQYWNGMSFFWFQLQREENLLRNISDKDLLASDSNGRILLHSVVCQGKRATVFGIAKRMAAMSQLDIKDAEGKTALHLAAQRNQHLMLADLLLLGANVNERDKFGKTCLHLSAENGYVRVVEVLKSYMNDGMYVNVEARDVNGLSALQCATQALNAMVRELEKNSRPSDVHFHTLRKEQLLDTLDCLLLMGRSPDVQYYKSQTMWDGFNQGCCSYAGSSGWPPRGQSLSGSPFSITGCHDVKCVSAGNGSPVNRQ